MASPNNGISPPSGYQIEVTPPSGYVLDNIPSVPLQQAPTPAENAPIHPVLNQVLSEYPGLSNNFNGDNTALVFADPQRSKRGLEERGGLEFWSKGDKGPDDYPAPDPTRNVLEIYSDKLKNDPAALKQAVYGDLLHGMSTDPYWSGLRSEFMQNFTPEEIKRQEQRQTWWDDVNSSKDKNGPTYDAYIRGVLANDGDWKKGQKESGNTMYSPKQIQVLKSMLEYLKTGKILPKEDHKKKPSS